MTDASTAAIVAGIPTTFEHTLTHPAYGELTFTAPAPKAPALLAHAVATDARLAPAPADPDADVAPVRVDRAQISAQTQMIAEAMAAIGPLIKAPVIAEHREEDDDGHVTLERTFYDPDDDEEVGVIVEVWLAFMAWRMAKLESYRALKSAVGNADGQTPSPSSAGASSEL